MPELYFSRLQEHQIEWARVLHNDPEVLSMLTDPHVVTPEEQIAWFARLDKSQSSQRLVVSDGHNDIGLVRLDQIDHHNKSVCVGLDIHKDYRGKGFAKPIYKHVLNSWFLTGFNRVWLMVAAYNARAVHLYQSLGFVHEGTQRQALLKDCEFFDYHMMSILKSDWSSNG